VKNILGLRKKYTRKNENITNSKSSLKATSKAGKPVKATSKAGKPVNNNYKVKNLSAIEILKNSPVDTDRVIITKIDPTQIKKPEVSRSIFDGPVNLTFKKNKINSNNVAPKKKITKIKPLTTHDIKLYKKKINDSIEKTNKIKAEVQKEINRRSLVLQDPDTKKDNLENGLTNDYYFQGPASELLKLNEKLYSLEEALDSIKNKTYGVCLKCKGNIEKKRLNVKPESLYHTYCKPVIEKVYDQSSPIDILISDEELINDNDEELVESEEKE
jgi:RNA polymerase-binding transcription factor DksA